MKGLDISNYQQNINFDDIKKAGIEFLILRRWVYRIRKW